MTSNRPRNARGRSASSASGRAAKGAAERFDMFADSVGSHRIAVVLVFFAFLALVFVGRLVFLQVIVAGEYSGDAEAVRTWSFTTTARRGTIYDRNGVVLATSVDATTVYCNPSEVTDPDYAASKISSVLGGEPADYLDALEADGTFAYIKRQADVDKAEQIESMELDGIYFIDDTRREYPYGSIGGQVVGMCDIDGNGISGLEYYYDDILKGVNGSYSAERGANGMPIPGAVHEDVAPVNGQDIMISIDIKLQDSVERALEAGVTDPIIGGEKGTSVVMDGETGEIYAIASLPYFDPSDPSESEAGSDNLTAVTQAIEPGSIFKTVSALAVLEAGTMTPDTVVYCPSYIQADEYTISDAHARAGQDMSLRDILDRSSNVGISLSVDTIGFQALYDAICRYNLNEVTGVDYPGESGGYLSSVDDWATVTGYNVSFGQGLSVTPLQMTRFYAMIENDGVEVTPHFLISKPQTGERPTYETEQVVSNQQALDDVTSMLRTVVTEGTGTPAAIEGYDVVGKTSTAEVARDGVYVTGLYNLCFTGFIDNSSSSLVCFVSANEVYSEASVASVFHDIMSSAIEQYNIVPE